MSHCLFYLPSQSSSSSSSNISSDFNAKSTSLAVITNMPVIKNYHNSASTAISIPSTLEYGGEFYLSTQDSSSISRMSSSSNDFIHVSPWEIKKSNWKRRVYILPTLFRPLLQLILLHLFIDEHKKKLWGKYHVTIVFITLYLL